MAAGRSRSERHLSSTAESALWLEAVEAGRAHSRRAPQRSLKEGPGEIPWVLELSTRSFDEISKVSARVEKKLLGSHWLGQSVSPKNIFFFFYFAFCPPEVLFDLIPRLFPKKVFSVEL